MKTCTPKRICLGIRDRLACGLLVLAALVAATWTILNVRAGLVPLTGGIGAVSSGLGFALIVLFWAIAC